MKIHLSKYAGFCDGVRRAYDMVMGLDMEKIKKPVYVLGSLVHNPEVNRKVEEKGISEIKREDFFNIPEGKIGTIIVTAHGVGPDVYRTAEEKGIDVIDTTCPKVIKVQRLAKHFNGKGYRLIIIGDRDHKEVRGINEWGGGHAFIISEKKDLIDLEVSPGQKLAILSQTTQNEEFCEEIGAFLGERYRDVKIETTTCRTTHERQEEIKKMARENEIMLVVGSKTSANSKRLWEIALAINPRSYFIESADDIRKSWFDGAGNVGVSAGASTPPWIIDKVLKKLESI